VGGYRKALTPCASTHRKWPLTIGRHNFGRTHSLKFIDPVPPPVCPEHVAKLAVHVLLCKTPAPKALRRHERTSTIDLFSLGLVPAQAFRASRSEAAPYGSDTRKS
jgi:hypothetical protein